MKIMVGIDGSKNALRALRFAIRLLRRIEGKNGSLTLISVHDDTALHAASHFVGRKAVDDYLAEQCREDLAPAIAVAAKSRLPYQAIGRTGPIAVTIANEAKKGKVDLLVLGSKGHSSIKSMLMGSIAQRVVMLCKVPVALVK